jgi:hypothetical protein
MPLSTQECKRLCDKRTIRGQATWTLKGLKVLGEKKSAEVYVSNLFY